MARIADRPWPLNYRPSAWNDPLDELAASLMPSYNAGVPRRDLGAVRELMRRAAPARTPHRIVVVGTNGKSSVATYVARLLHAAGRRVGLYTSPHLRSWTERIQVGLEPVAPAAFEEALLRVHDAAARVSAQPGDLRFFDVLTVAAEDVFARAGVEFAVFEAGIGGRLDATRCLDPELVLLTSIGADHEELLGHDPAERLREKALAAPAGAMLISAPLGNELELCLGELASEHGIALRVLPRAAGNLELARAAAGTLVAGADLLAIAEGLPGRMQRGELGGVPYIADVAHNPTAWGAFLDALPDERHVVVTAISAPRPAGALAAELARARAKVDRVVVTSTTVRPAQPPDEVAAAIAASGIEAEAVAEPERAFQRALENGRPLAVFGSNYLVVDFLAFSDARASSPWA